MKIKFAVTQRDIDRGVEGSSMGCPIALALRRETKTEVSVGRERVLMFVGGKVHRAYLPKYATRFTLEFDDNEPVAPIELELEFEEGTK